MHFGFTSVFTSLFRQVTSSQQTLTLVGGGLMPLHWTHHLTLWCFSRLIWTIT